MNIIKKYHKISIAPMMEITDNHFRNFFRLLTKETVLYTEMIHHDTIMNSRRGAQKELYFDKDQRPVVIQLGGNNPNILEKISIMCKEAGYDEINLNCGCPSSKVVNGNFGVSLMTDPELVADITNRLRQASNMEVTVKCRLGIDSFNEEFLEKFISTVATKGNVNHFIIHARLALMQVDTDKNRKIPPLQYDTVLNLKRKFPQLLFSINGGIKSYEDLDAMLMNPEISGNMIGRAAYDNPWMFGNIDKKYFEKNNPGLSRKEVIYKYSEYLEKIQDQGCPYNELVKPLTNLFSGERKSSYFKNLLYSYKKEKENFTISEYVRWVVDEYEKKNEKAVNVKWDD